MSVANPSSIFRQSSRAEVHVVNQDGTEFDIPPQDILQVSVTNDLASPGGSFAIAVKSGESKTRKQGPAQQSVTLDNTHADDFVYISLGTSGDMTLEHVGLIDRVDESTEAAGGATSTTMTLSGRDAVGKILHSTQIFYDPSIPGSIPIEQQLQQRLDAVGLQIASLTPDQIIPSLIQFFAGQDGQWVHPLTGNPFLARLIEGGFADYESLMSTSVHGKTASDEILSVSGSLWSVLEKYADRMLNEFYIDTMSPVPGVKPRPHVILHVHPYDVSSGQPDSFLTPDDTFVVEADPIYSHEVQSSRFGTSDVDLLNVVKALTTVAGNQSDDFRYAFPPLFDPVSVQEHGFRLFYEPTFYPYGRDVASVDFVSANTGAILSTLQTLSQRLFRWHVMGDRYLSGSITLGHLRNDIRVGNRVPYINRRSGKIRMFYVERVTHTFTYNGVSTTSIEVSRGIPHPSTPDYQTFMNERRTRIQRTAHAFSGNIPDNPNE